MHPTGSYFLMPSSDLSQIPNPGVGSKARLNLCVNRIKKAVLSRVPFLQHNNGVSALGYACVLEDPRLPDTDFFTAGRRFRVRLRYIPTYAHPPQFSNDAKYISNFRGRKMYNNNFRLTYIVNW